MPRDLVAADLGAGAAEEDAQLLHGRQRAGRLATGFAAARIEAALSLVAFAISALLRALAVILGRRV